MDQKRTSKSNRRDFLKTTSTIAAASALSGILVPHVHAAGDDMIRLAIVGCGGRGGGAVLNALSTTSGPIKLIAMADVFDDHLKVHYDSIKKRFGDDVDVPPERRFIGFDAYQKAMDCLKPGDVVILTTPPAFRWVHFKYAIDKGLNVFMEKPISVDGPSTRRMFALADEAIDKNLKVGVGLMCRHCDARGELFERIKLGQIGDIIAMRCYRMHGPVADCFTAANDGKVSELLYQVKKFHSFLWASGGLFSDFYIHNIDECCWMKDAWPIKAEATGGRTYRGEYVDQNFDAYSVEYTFLDGAKLFVGGRCMDGCSNEFASYAHGTKGLAVISSESHTPARSRIYRGQLPDKEKLIWAYPQPERNPYQLEWDHLIMAIRKDKPYNEVRRGAETSLITSMGRMAAHTGQVITRDQILMGDHEFAPEVDKLTMDSPAPLQCGADGKYPVPQPGLKKMREF
jgi:predicted dehydrogenase